MTENFSYKKWLKKNKERISRLKSPPSWIEKNRELLKLDSPLNKKGVAKTNKANLPFGKKEVKKTNAINIAEFIKGDAPTNKEMKNILFAYADIFKEDFRRGVESVKFRKASSYLMQHSMAFLPLTKEWSSGSRFTISTYTFAKGFNPAEDLRGALANIKKGKNLTFNQEYAIESLWHEILHAKTKAKPRRHTKEQIDAMETVNQFVARHTYPNFLKRLGGKATNQKEILDNGYGYSKWIREFRRDLKLKGIKEKDAVKYLEPHLMRDYSSLRERMDDLLLNQ